MAVATSDSGTRNTNANSIALLDLTTLTVTASSNLMLIAGLFHGTAVSATSAVWDQGGTNQAMTSAGVALTSNRRVEFFYLANPTAGNKTLRWSWTTNADTYAFAICFQGVSEVVAADTITDLLQGISPSLTVTSSTDGATIAGAENNNNYYSAPTQTDIFFNTSGNLVAAASYALGGTSNDHAWTGGGGGTALLGIHLSAAVAGGASIRVGSLLAMFQ